MSMRLPDERMCMCHPDPNKRCGKTYEQAVNDLMSIQMLSRYQAESIINELQVKSKPEWSDLADVFWASIDDKGIKGRLYWEDCIYLAKVALENGWVKD